jgi:hypothetical protein
MHQFTTTTSSHAEAVTAPQQQLVQGRASNMSAASAPNLVPQLLLLWVLCVGQFTHSLEHQEATSSHAETVTAGSHTQK